MTTNGRRTPIEDNLQWKTTYNGRWPQNIKVEYLSSHWSDLPQILNISSWDQTRVKKGFNGRRPLMEDDLKIGKFEYLRSHWLDLPQILSSLNFELKLKGPLNIKSWLMSTHFIGWTGYMVNAGWGGQVHYVINPSLSWHLVGLWQKNQLLMVL